jgi:phospholipase/lecithinase/hemolysin
MAISTDISDLVVFGDSLSDNGNLFKQFGISLRFSWEGRASNGPVYAEQLAQLLGVQLDDQAFAGAEASDSSPPGLPLPINLPEQVAGYLAELNGNSAPLGTEALINIGLNDYEAYFQSNLPKDPQSVHNFVASVVGSIEQAVDALTNAGVEKIILFTLPDAGAAALLGGLPPPVATFAHTLALANNAALEQMAASHPNVQVVDVLPLWDALFMDPHSFGFIAPLQVTWSSLLVNQSTQFAPNEVAFFDGAHPTTAAHGVLAAFADAVLTSDHVQFLDGTQTTIHAQRGTNFIFATNDPFHPVLNDNYTIYGESGSDLIFAGSGNVTVYGGSGTDLIAAGSGNATLVGGNGTDVLETNSTGTNVLIGGHGQDALIVNRGGTNTLLGGTGDDLFILKESASLVNADGTFNFGQQEIAGGKGGGTLLFIINDQHPIAENALKAEFQRVVSAFNAAAQDHHPGSFQIDGLQVTGITGIELQVDSVSTDSHTITHNVQIVGQAPEVSSDLSSSLHTASTWNLLAV